MSDIPTYAAVVGGSFAAALGLTPLAIALARKAGIVDLPNARKVHQTPTPRTGGVAIAVASLAASVAAALLYGFVSHIPGAAGEKILALAAAGGFVFLVGLADDVFNIASQWKLAALLAAALAVCAAGIRVDAVGLNGALLGVEMHLPLGLAAWPLTVLWIVAVTVSVNFMDGLDGLAGGLGAIGCAALAVATAAAGHPALAVVALGLLGGIGGFLVYNVNPARVFMGDGGSMFLGFTLGGLSVLCANYVGTTGGLLLPGLVLAVPLIDAVATFVRRGVLQRRSIFSAERGHIHHRLLDLGLCPWHAVLVLYGVTLLGALVGLTGFFGGRWTLVGGGLFFGIAVAGLFRMSGSVRVRHTIAAVRRNRAIAKEASQYRRAFEESQLRFRHVCTFDGWWAEVCTAAEHFDFVGLELPLTNRDGTLRIQRWRRTDSQFGDCEVVRAVMPVRHRRHGPAVQAQVEVAIHTVLESAGKRLALFSRLLGEHSLADLPDPVAATAAGPAAKPVDPSAVPANDHDALIGAGGIFVDGVPLDDSIAGADMPSGLGFAALGTGGGDDWVPDPAAINGELADDAPLVAIPPGQPGGPRVAIVHDFLYTYAGAEKVLEQILNVFPEADLFSLFDFLPPGQRGFIKDKPVTTSFIQRLPFARRKHRSYLPLMPLAVEQLDVSAYDIVISSSYVAAKGVITRPGQLHVSYCHSPVRFAWDLQHQYLAEAGVRGVKSLVARAILHYIRNWDARSAAGVDVFVTNSRFVSGRVRKFYRRDSVTIYPPVDVERFTVGGEREDYYLTASRMVPYKRIDLIVEAFTKMADKRLIVVGEGPDFEKIKAKAGPNVRLVGRVSDERLQGYMRRAKAFVFAAEEDFGIVPVEAQACGTPVIAYGRGGVTESVVDGQTGVFFRDQTVESLAAAVRRFETIEWDPAIIRAQAERFSPRRFRDQVRRLVAAEWGRFMERQGAPLWVQDDDLYLVASDALPAGVERQAS